MKTNIKDCSPGIGEKVANGATVIAKHLTAALSDQNEYVVLCYFLHKTDSEVPYEYVTWTLMANEERYDTMWGHYHLGNFVAASKEFANRAGLDDNKD